jgi:3-oxoacyl-[acyl-carrier-protein] synthase-3
MTGIRPRHDLFVRTSQRPHPPMARKLDVAPGKIVVTLQRHGNTSAASIPLALNQAF